MKLLLLSSLITVCLNLNAFASNCQRCAYTVESMESATHIGSWSSKTIDATGQLKKPATMLMGNFKTLNKIANASYSKSLKAAIKKIQQNRNRRYILLITVIQGQASIVDSESEGWLDTDHTQHKMIKRLAEQIQQKRKWKTYSTREQIERSEVILSGHLFTKVHCVMSPWIVTQKNYRGVPPKNPTVCLSNWEKGDSLFFLQRQAGSGPEFMVMHTIPLKEAGPYLKLLKEFKRKK